MARGIEVVVKAINTHIENHDVCENGFWALRNMVVNNGKMELKYNKQQDGMNS